MWDQTKWKNLVMENMQHSLMAKPLGNMSQVIYTYITFIYYIYYLYTYIHVYIRESHMWIPYVSVHFATLVWLPMRDFA